MKNSLLIGIALASVAGMVCQAQTVQDLGITDQSSFKFSQQGHDPFLPVGWQKPPDALPAESGASAPASLETLLKPELFLVSSISVDRIRLAVINGKLYGEGESFPFMLEGKQPVKVQVVKIQDGMVTLACGPMQVNCPLRISAQKTAKKP